MSNHFENRKYTQHTYTFLLLNLNNQIQSRKYSRFNLVQNQNYAPNDRVNSNSLIWNKFKSFKRYKHVPLCVMDFMLITLNMATLKSNIMTFNDAFSLQFSNRIRVKLQNDNDNDDDDDMLAFQQYTLHWNRIDSNYRK